MDFDIHIKSYSSDEVQIIIDKIDTLFLEYIINSEIIRVTDKIDIKIYSYLIDFSTV